ncbi:MAG: hypothetical protein WAO55_03765 [Candidatus Manganitrophaceae bacterium]
MKTIKYAMLGMLFLLPTAALAQNIQTNTTSTTVGSRTFGFDITPSQLQTIIQSANPLTCGGRGADGVMNCSLDNFVKAPGMPGSFTGNPFKIVWPEADFGCGAPCATNGGADPQTAPDFAGPNTLNGRIETNIDLGLGTASGDPFHLAGHLRFTLDPSNMNASIDQQILQEINTPGGLSLAFGETDTAASFTAGADPSIFSFAGPVGFITRTTLSQTGELGLPSSLPFALDVTLPFNYGGPFNAGTAGLSGDTFPIPEAFTTPGLQTRPDDPRTPDVDESSLFPVIF